MSLGWLAKCKNCCEEFTVYDGPSFSRYAMRCDRCGRTRWVRLETLSRHGWYYGRGDLDAATRALSRCRCGGRYGPKTPPRCIACKSDDIVDTGKLKMILD